MRTRMEYRVGKGGGAEVKSEVQPEKKAVFKKIFEVRRSQHFRETDFSKYGKGGAGKTHPDFFRSEAGLLKF